MPSTCRLFPELRIPFEISRYARNDDVIYETESAAAVNIEPLFCSYAAATLVSGQRVIPNAVRNLEPHTSHLIPLTSHRIPQLLTI